MYNLRLTDWLYTTEQWIKKAISGILELRFLRFWSLILWYYDNWYSQK